MKIKRSVLSFLVFGLALILGIETTAKERVIVLTDITNEPDDQESLVRFLVYANEFDVEGLIATSSTWLRGRISPQNIKDCVEAYGRVRDNLLVHAEGYPTASHLQSLIKNGRPEFGMGGVGAGKSSEGSRHIIEMVDRKDERPVWISIWGGANCLAQALWEVKESRSEAEVKQFVSKLRVYTISDQDDAGPWMRQTFPELFYIVSSSGERGDEYYQATWTGISGDNYYLNGPRHHIDLVSNTWLNENVRTGHGPLGAMYPPWEYIMEGDTPSYMNLINNGLGSHINPGYGGWGGRYAFKKLYAWPGAFWTDTRDVVRTPDGQTHISGVASIWRWRQDFQHDFAARMDWCITRTYEGANHNPVVVANGDSSKDILHINAELGSSIVLDAAGTSDPDGDEIRYRWFHYAEAGLDITNRNKIWSVEISGSNQTKATVKVPDEMPRRVGKDIHIILDVEDDGEPSLHAYRRIILHTP